jgi:hypothetical protein
VGDTAGKGRERDGGQGGQREAGVSRRGFVVGVVAAGAAARAAGTLPGQRAALEVPGAGAGRAAAGTCGSFSLGAGAPTGGGELSDVAFVSAGELWAVGSAGAGLSSNRTLVERFDGSGWSVVSSPDQGGGDNGLNGVSMISGGGWAVGYARLAGGTHGGTYEPLALRWDGAQWSLASPAAFTSDALLTSVDTLADGSAWAVGFQTTAAGARRTLIEHASGGAWAQVASPNVMASADNSLMAVSGTQATGLWAVGYWLSPTGLQPLVLRYDTTRPSPAWALVSGVPSVGKIDTVLTGVDVRTASDVWAVGYYSDGSAERPLALHWDGSTWTSSPVPGAGLLRKVSGRAGQRVGSGGLLQRERGALPDARGAFRRDGMDDGDLGQPHRCSRRDHRPCGRPGGVDDHPGGPAGLPPAHRTGKLPHRTCIAPHPGSCAGSCLAGRSGRRPRAEPTAQDPPHRRPRSQ